MNVAGFHHKILVGLTAWTRYFSDEQLVYFTTSMSSQKKPGVNAKKMGGKFSKYDECCWFSSQNLGWPDCSDTFFFVMSSWSTTQKARRQKKIQDFD